MRLWRHAGKLWIEIVTISLWTTTTIQTCCEIKCFFRYCLNQMNPLWCCSYGRRWITNQSTMKLLIREGVRGWIINQSTMLLVSGGGSSAVVVMWRSRTASCRAGLTVKRVLLGQSTWDPTSGAVAYSWGRQSQLWVVCAVYNGSCKPQSFQKQKDNYSTGSDPSQAPTIIITT